MSFSKLFRSSAFAKFDPKTPRIFEKHLAPKFFEKELKFEDVPHTPTFGLKADPPATIFGKKIKWASFKDLDGTFGAATFVNEENKVLQRKILENLVILNREIKNSPGKELPKIPGRVTSAAEGGFIIAMGPVMAFLSQSEIPIGAGFNYSDILDQKAYYFRLKGVEQLQCKKLKVKTNQDVFEETIHNSKMTKPSYDSVAAQQGFKVLLTLKQ